MTTETEPMVRVVSIICEECGFDHNVTNASDPEAYKQTFRPSFIREYWGKPNRCRGCERLTMGRVATEPVR